MKCLAVAVMVVVACNDAPRDVPASHAAAHGVEVESRRSTVKAGKLAWGGLVTNVGERLVRGADVVVIARGKGGSEVGRGRGHADVLPSRYGIRLEVNGIVVSSTPARVDVALEHVDVAPIEEQPIKWKPASVSWKKPLPDGVAFAVQEDEKCAGHLGKQGDPATFRCVVGVRHTGTRAVRELRLRFELPRGGEAIEVKANQPSDLPIEPGDALVYFVHATMRTPSETILTGTAEAK